MTPSRWDAATRGSSTSPYKVTTAEDLSGCTGFSRSAGSSQLAALTHDMERVPRAGSRRKIVRRSLYYRLTRSVARGLWARGCARMARMTR